MSPTQEQVLVLIAAGSAITEAARSAGIHRNTINYWLRTSPQFHDALEHAHHSQALYWREHALRLAGSALYAIQEIVEDHDASPGIRLRAALAIFPACREPEDRAPAQVILRGATP